MRTISIQPATHHSAEQATEEIGAVRKVKLPLTRRELLRGTGVIFGHIAAGSALVALAPSTAWALELRKLNEKEGRTLMAMGKVLYPHKQLPDAAYALLAKDLDAKAQKNADTAKQLVAGIRSLHQAAGGDFLKASPEIQLQIVKSLEGKPFFATVRGQCITSLYDNDIAFAAFGYPGASWDKGGYITRGFQDLQWLPEPPLEISPKPYFG
ncbi:tat (twin-arginine translocation) pathway signal sequence [Azohydromonas lata]|uniref:tat (twin-arginine translocation) pathway signal sequence n=1 Tax=Azohydromonas lata TaxID=45677 RepID=UPI001EE48549|nr:tat (twin-arginine translocation) pathway signal sequence [Azohydromonas lata]